LRAAAPFIGSRGGAELDRERPDWRRDAALPAASPELQNIIDLYRVRELVGREIVESH
jgi:hypothetical protein